MPAGQASSSSAQVPAPGTAEQQLAGQPPVAGEGVGEAAGTAELRAPGPPSPAAIWDSQRRLWRLTDAGWGRHRLEQGREEVTTGPAERYCASVTFAEEVAVEALWAHAVRPAEDEAEGSAARARTPLRGSPTEASVGDDGGAPGAGVGEARAKRGAGQGRGGGRGGPPPAAA